MRITLLGALVVAGLLISLILLFRMLRDEQRNQGGQEPPAPRPPGF